MHFVQFPTFDVQKVPLLLDASTHAEWHTGLKQLEFFPSSTRDGLPAFHLDLVSCILSFPRML